MTSKIRFIVAGFAFPLLIYALERGRLDFAALFAAIIMYMVWSHFKEGSVFLATQAFQDGDLPKAKALLKQIKNPDRLRKGRRSYYEFIMANIAMKEGDLDKAEYHFQFASRLPWRNDQQKGMILISLANINLMKKRYDRVERYLEVASKLKLTQKQQSIFQKIEKELIKHL